MTSYFVWVENVMLFRAIANTVVVLNVQENSDVFKTTV